MREPRRPRRAPAAVLAAVVALPVVGVGGPLAGVFWYRGQHVRVPLLAQGVALTPAGEPADLADGAQLLPGSRVLRPADPADPAQAAAAERLAARQRAWLAAGTVPGGGTPWAAMVETALLDLHTLSDLAPARAGRERATVAAWSGHWRYVWPRDAAFVAVALARTGHAADAADVLAFVQPLQRADGVFDARYLRDARDPGDVPDDRGVQLDGTGWVLWAAAETARALPAGARAAFLARLRPMIERSTDAALRLTDTPGALPPVSADYWETDEDTLTLGTAAPLATGLDAAAELWAMLGDEARAATARARGGALRAAIRDGFGPDGYPRHLGGSRRDAAITFLLPPFAPAPEPGVVAAWTAAAEEMARPAGGLAPGAGWKNDGISWTPETALYALTAAATGRRAEAEHWLRWLGAHRTAAGSLPEKVLSDGAPAGPAPLAWTAATVVLAAAALEG